ncbi:PREDICTED: odorant receptor 33b-like [Rhagoletis zephyria]|uniref:odorant receptor 33b-like n=1 Tax=Rhagoletis zephyria TaxID=28612 RepID=UPI00081195C6|nr:PREDICTED: odorant receptor 33b-like [Rhagoletis zephyria]
MVNSPKFAEPIDTVSLYRFFWACWHALGISTEHNKYLCGFYDLFLNIFVTIFNPAHLIVGLFLNPTPADLFKNLSITITCFVCSVKHYLLRRKLPQIRVVQSLLADLDKRVMDADEREYYHCELTVAARNIVKLFSIAYSGANIAAISATLLSKERRLMYPAWLPFNWQANAFTYYVAVMYQIAGVSIQIVQNLANDIYPPMSLCIIAGHLHLLALRIAKVGADKKKTLRQHNQALIECIEDHKKLVRIFSLTQDTLSLPQLAQFISSGLNMCIVLFYLLFYVDNFFSYIYYAVYFVSMGIELLPSCYYGSKLIYEFQQLPSVIFQCSWLGQSREFYMNQRIFMELSLKTIIPMAGGVIGIQLNSFLGTCKMAYSLYTVCNRMK